MPQPHSATLVSLSSNAGTNNITVRDVGAGRMVEVKNATTGVTAGSQFLEGSTDNATIDVSSQPNPFRATITVHVRNSPYTAWASKTFDNVYQGDSFAVLVESGWNPPILRGYTDGYQDRTRKLLRYRDFQRDIIQGHDDEYRTFG